MNDKHSYTWASLERHCIAITVLSMQIEFCTLSLQSVTDFVWLQKNMIPACMKLLLSEAGDAYVFLLNIHICNSYT